MIDLRGRTLRASFSHAPVRGEIEFLEDCKWVLGFGGHPTFQTVKARAQSSGFSIQSFLTDTAPVVKKGHHEKLMGFMNFQKTEKGWRGTEMDMVRVSAK